jgi:hypothetical protein
LAISAGALKVTAMSSRPLRSTLTSAPFFLSASSTSLARRSTLPDTAFSMLTS